jgi:hypothetical protein
MKTKQRRYGVNNKTIRVELGLLTYCRPLQYKDLVQLVLLHSRERKLVRGTHQELYLWFDQSP